MPLPGVTVVVKGTFNGAKTNEKGRYALSNDTEKTQCWCSATWATKPRK